MIPVEVLVPGNVLLTQVGIQFQAELDPESSYWRFRLRAADTLQYATMLQVYWWRDGYFWQYDADRAVYLSTAQSQIREGPPTSGATDRIALVPIGLGQRARIVEISLDEF